jgi:hypothetical protein
MAGKAFSCGGEEKERPSIPKGIEGLLLDLFETPGSLCSV